MATYFVSSSGSNTSPYDTWAKAATNLTTALSAATSSGDTVVIQYNAIPTINSEAPASVTLTVANNIKLLAASNNGGSSYTLTPMGTSYWIGNSTTARSITISGPYAVYVYGLTFRDAATTGVYISICNDTDAQHTYDNCYFWHANVSSSSAIRVGPVAVSSSNAYAKIKNCTFRMGNSGQSIRSSCNVDFENCSFDTNGVAITDLFEASDSSDPASGVVNIIGCDLSYAATSPSLVADCSRPTSDFNFVQCKLPTSFSLLAAQTVNNKSSARAWLYDCASGDSHGLFGYADALGSVVIDTSIYYTSNPANVSWKIVTTSYCSELAVFDTPWIDWYNTGTSAVTPRLEILRDGSTTAFTDAEVWGEFTAKTTSGSTKSTFYTDKSLLGNGASNQTSGAGLASWTGESGTAWSGKLNTTTTITPAEVGVIRARIAVAIPSTTFYVDPMIRV